MYILKKKRKFFVNKKKRVKFFFIILNKVNYKLYHIFIILIFILRYIMYIKCFIVTTQIR